MGKTTGVYESDLNLKYSRELARQLNDMGISVVMTRNSSDGLYDSSASNLKRSEMKKREEIICSSSCNLVVSIHMNSFPIRSVRGAQVFYKKGSEQGLVLADCIQDNLNQNIPYAKKTSKVGDYYVLNCSDKPSALIECGFLSNGEEELLLQNKEYTENFCHVLACGIVEYLDGM